MKQLNLIRERDWDYLLVLDACRFDYFEELYKKYLEGDLKKVTSPVSPENDFATTDWLKKVFFGYFENVIYVSATPRINSTTEVDGFTAKEHFPKIVDVWDFGWREEAGTVPPENVNNAVLENLKINNNMKIIIHYMQPHTPYLNYDGPKNITTDPNFSKKLSHKISIKLAPKIRSVLGPGTTRSLSDLLGLPPVDHLDYILREYGEEKLKEAYRENLNLVLKEVKNLIDELSGKIAVTSDHGELLGENDYYGHSYLPSHPVLTEVPWLEVSH